MGAAGTAHGDPPVTQARNLRTDSWLTCPGGRHTCAVLNTFQGPEAGTLAELSLLPSDVLGQGAWGFLKQNHSHLAGVCLCPVPAFTPATVGVGKGVLQDGEGHSTW